MKKMLTLLLALCLCLGAFAAPASAQESLSGTLEFWHYWSADSEFENVDLVVEKFNEIYPDVEVVVTSFSRDELMKLYTMGAVSGELPDIAMMDNPEMNAFIKMGLCADITDYVTAWDQTSHYYEGPMLSCMDEGRYYGLPHNSNCLELFYDVDMLEGAGCTPPTTWSELMDVCAKLKETYPNVYPIGFSANNNEEGTFQFAPFMLSAGGSFEQLDSEGAIEAAALWKDMKGRDWFMSLLDVEDYIAVKERAIRDYGDRRAWAEKMLVNIAKSGYFSSDRTIRQYNEEIWRLK